MGQTGGHAEAGGQTGGSDGCMVRGDIEERRRKISSRSREKKSCLKFEGEIQYYIKKEPPR